MVWVALLPGHGRRGTVHSHTGTRTSLVRHAVAMRDVTRYAGSLARCRPQLPLQLSHRAQRGRPAALRRSCHV